MLIKFLKRYMEPMRLNGPWSLNSVGSLEKYPWSHWALLPLMKTKCVDKVSNEDVLDKVAQKQWKAKALMKKKQVSFFGYVNLEIYATTVKKEQA